MHELKIFIRVNCYKIIVLFLCSFVNVLYSQDTENISTASDWVIGTGMPSATHAVTTTQGEPTSYSVKIESESKYPVYLKDAGNHGLTVKAWSYYNGPDGQW